MPGLVDWAIKETINDLGNEDTRAEALKTMKGFGVRAVPALIEALTDPIRNVYATLALVDVGEPAIPALLDALIDEFRGAYAAATLIEIGKKKSKTQGVMIPRLIDALADPRKQVFAFTSLRGLGSPALTPFLPSLVNSLGNPTSSELAAQLLVGIGKPAAQHLTRASSDDNKRELATHILQEIAKTDPTVQVPTTVTAKEATKPNTQPLPQRTRFCTNCGTKASEGDRFCESCGTRLRAP